MRLGGWVLLAMVVGCGSDDAANGSPTGRATASQSLVGEHCTAWKGWHERCAQSPDELAAGESFYQECLEDPRWALTWAAVLEELVGCFEQLPCEASDDRCSAEAFETLGIDTDDPLLARCLERAGQCDVLDDNCEGVVVYNDEARAAIDACIDADCDTFGLCILDPLGTSN